MVDEILDNVGCAVAVNLLAAGEGEVDVIFRLEALGNQIIGSGENAVECNLSIQSATAPEDTVLQNGGKGRLLPVFFIDGHHIIVGHQHRRIAVVLAGPPQQ